MKECTFIGIDLHARSSYILGRRPDKSVCVSGSVPNEWAAIEPALERCDGQRIVGLEAVGNWPWLAYGLLARGCRVHLFHPPSMAPYRQGRAKNDRIDADLLAGFAAEPWRLKSSWLCPADLLEIRSGLRARRQMVDVRTGMRNRIHALLKQHNKQCPFSDLFDSSGLSWLAGQDLRPGVRACIDSLLIVERALTREIARTQERIWPEAQGSPACRAIAALPQAGPVTALTIALESGDMSRFRNTGSYVAHCGLAPWTFESAGKRRASGLCPKGNKALKVAYSEWAFRLLRFGGDDAFSAVRESFADRPVHDAKIMLGRKLAGAVLSLVCRREEIEIERLCRKRPDSAA